uniref:hypothetical protein n=1 Tax=Streptomyces sp. NBC_01592 TaxID=2975889 RepID=UPI002F90CA3B
MHRTRPVTLVHKVNAHAERWVEKQLTAELKKVRGKESILFKPATAAVDKPDGAVRRALFPGGRGEDAARAGRRGEGEREGLQGQGPHHAALLLQLVLPAELPPLLNRLGFECNNTAYRQVMDAMKLLKKYADVDGKTRFYDATDCECVRPTIRRARHRPGRRR